LSDKNIYNNFENKVLLIKKTSNNNLQQLFMTEFMFWLLTKPAPI